MKRKRTKGLTLIEVLVTLLVLAIGLLGLGALQNSGLRYNHSSLLRSQATLLAYDILDRMRVNKDHIQDYAIDLGTHPPGVTDCSTETCMSAYDLTQWKNQISQLLPKGDGAIAVQRLNSANITDPLHRVTITIQWDDTRGQGQVKRFIFVTEI